MEKIVFLDRDGVISKDSVYHIKSWEEFHFLPGAKQALRLLHENGFHVIVITNQSVIGRGMVTREGLEEIHMNMVKEITESGGQIEKIYYCPHHPDDGCECRKPKPGLLIKAIQENRIDAHRSFMVGDRMMDVEAGKAVGCKTVLISLDKDGKELEKSVRKPDFIAQTLLDASKWIIKMYPSLI